MVTTSDTQPQNLKNVYSEHSWARLKEHPWLYTSRGERQCANVEEQCPRALQVSSFDNGLNVVLMFWAQGFSFVLFYSFLLLV